MYEVKQAAVARAIEILRPGPLTAAGFAVKMWPDRVADRTHGQHSKMGHSFLRRLGELNYVSRIGDLWTVSVFDGRTAGGQAVQGAANGHFNGRDAANWYPVGPPPNGHGTANGYSTQPFTGQATDQGNGQATEHAERHRLHRLVGQATEPVSTVAHDAAFGNIAVRGIPLDGALAEACAIVVLSGRNANIYPACGAPRMLVGLQPAEAARALLVRWQQCGQPPDLARPGAWITAADGFVASSGFWRPSNAPAGWVDLEDVRTRIMRQRAAEGLA